MSISSNNGVDSIKKKDTPESKKLDKEYTNAKKKFIIKSSEPVTIINIYKQYAVRKYGITYKDKVIKNKESPEALREWCNKNFLNSKKLERVKYESGDIGRKFGKIVGRERNRNPNRNKIDSLFVDNPDEITMNRVDGSDGWKDNLIRALYDGFYINIIQKGSPFTKGGKPRHKKYSRQGKQGKQGKYSGKYSGKFGKTSKSGGVYTTCFPLEKTSTGVSQDSLIKPSKKYMMYCDLKSIFNKKSYAILTELNETFIKKTKKDIIELCNK